MQFSPIVTNSEHSSKVFGAIYNASLHIVNKNNPDIVFYSAKFQNDDGNQEIFNKRVRIYKLSAHRIAQHGQYNEIQDNPIKSKYALNFVLVNRGINLTTEEINDIKKKI